MYRTTEQEASVRDALRSETTAKLRRVRADSRRLIEIHRANLPHPDARIRVDANEAMVESVTAVLAEREKGPKPRTEEG